MSSHKSSNYKKGQIVSARVERVFPFGVFVRLPDGTEAYVRKWELTQAGNLDPRQLMSIGQEITGKVIALAGPDRSLELSIRQTEPDPWDEFVQSSKAKDTVTVAVKGLSADGAFVQIIPGVDGFIPLSELAPWKVQQPDDLLWIGDQAEAMITHLDRQAKRVRLSIRRQMLHMAEVQKIAGHLKAGAAPSEPNLERTEPGDSGAGDTECFDIWFPDRVLVLDDHPGICEELVVWLKRHGCQVDGFDRLDAALERVEREAYGLALVDLDVAGQDGLEFIRTLQEIAPGTRVMVMSIPEWIAERSQDLEALQILEVFTKPLDLHEILETLARLARGESIGPFQVTEVEQADEISSSFQRLAKTMRSGFHLEARLETGLKELVGFTQAELGALFRLDPISQQVSVVAQVGRLSLNHEAVYTLSASPVKDLILEGGEVFEARVSAQVRRRFQKLLDVVRFGACLGVPVSAAGKTEHALFLFHHKPDVFSHHHLRDARATAMLLRVTLESQALEERIQATSPFLLSGHLAAGFGHDVFNKMSALELQVRNLRAACGTMDDKEAVSRSTSSPDCSQVMDSMDRLVETVLDLKQTVNAFRELLGADHQVKVDVNHVIQRAVQLLQPIARRNKVDIEVDAASGLPSVAGSPVRLQQAFLNVMMNAVQHIAQKADTWAEAQSKLKITTGVTFAAERPVWVRFTDAGPGIHRQWWENIFALGFSTRPEGTGLGLFIARSLVESMGGTICVEESLIPSTTTFGIELPAVPESG